MSNPNPPPAVPAQLTAPPAAVPASTPASVPLMKAPAPNPALGDTSPSWPAFPNGVPTAANPVPTIIPLVKPQAPLPPTSPGYVAEPAPSNALQAYFGTKTASLIATGLAITGALLTTLATPTPQNPVPEPVVQYAGIGLTLLGFVKGILSSGFSITAKL